MSATTPPGISFKENKMNIPMYQVDAFTSTVFSGNPAAVCLLDTWLDDAVLQAVAAEKPLFWFETPPVLTSGGLPRSQKWPCAVMPHWPARLCSFTADTGTKIQSFLTPATADR
jgi:hypothetical protein